MEGGCLNISPIQMGDGSKLHGISLCWAHFTEESISAREAVTLGMQDMTPSVSHWDVMRRYGPLGTHCISHLHKILPFSILATSMEQNASRNPVVISETVFSLILMVSRPIIINYIL